MSFAATCIQLEIIRLRQISYDITYMWNIKCDTNDLSETESQP